MKKTIILFYIILLQCKSTNAQIAEIQVLNNAGKMLGNHTGEFKLEDNFSIDKSNYAPAPIMAGSKIGFVNTSGNLVIPVKYTPVKRVYFNRNNTMEVLDSYNKFNEGIVPLCLDGKCGALDSLGKTVVPFKYKYINAFYNGLAIVMSDNKIGFVNTKGELAVAEQFDNVTDFEYGYAIATLKNSSGNDYKVLLDKTGKQWFANEQYEEMEYLHKEMVQIKSKGLSGVFDTKNSKWIFPMSVNKDGFKSYDKLINGGLLTNYYDKEEQSKVLGLITPSGVFSKIGNYSDYEYYESEKVFAFRNTDGKFAFFDNAFKQESAFEFESVGRKMHNGLVDVVKNGKIGVVTKTGLEVIPFQYNKESYSITDNCEVQPNNTIVIRQDNKYWLINTKGEKILPGPYDFLYYQANNLYKFKQNGKYGLIDISGKILVPADKDDVYFYLPNLVTIKKDTKWSLTNTEGKILLPSEYDAIYSQGYLIAEGKKAQLFDIQKAGNIGVVDNQGKSLLPLGYAKIYRRNDVIIAQKGMSYTELATAEVKQYKKMLANLSELATNYEKAKNLYNNKGNCPGGCLDNYKIKTAEFLKVAKSLSNYFNNSKTLGTNPEHSATKTQLAKIVADAETNNTDVQNLSDVANNNVGGNIGDGKLQGITSNVREVQWIIEADTKARKQVGIFNIKIKELANCLKNYKRSDCQTLISHTYQLLEYIKEYANDKIRYVRQMSLDLQKKEFGQEMQSVFEDQLRDVEKIKTDLDAALKQPSLLDAIIMGMTRAFGSR
jgi:hypothetical protein